MKFKCFSKDIPCAVLSQNILFHERGTSFVLQHLLSFSSPFWSSLLHCWDNIRTNTNVITALCLTLYLVSVEHHSLSSTLQGMAVQPHDSLKWYWCPLQVSGSVGVQWTWVWRPRWEMGSSLLSDPWPLAGIALWQVDQQLENGW